jgi:hypothetical protein
VSSSPRAQTGGRRTRRPGVAASAVAAALVVAALPVLASPAVAVITPVTAPATLEVTPTLDIVLADGFDAPAVVEVWRNGVRVGTSGAPNAAAPLELNHAGPPCWSGATPDIIAGDEIRVVTDTTDPADPVGQSMTVADLDAEAAQLVALDPDGARNDVVMTGWARTPDGTGPIPVAQLSATIVNPAFRTSDQQWKAKSIGALPGGALPTTQPFRDGQVGVLAYDAVGAGNTDGTRWTATWKNLPGQMGPLAQGGAQTIQSAENPAFEGVGLTVVDVEDASGGVPGCPAGATDAVTTASHENLGLAAHAAGGEFVVSGTSYHAAAVRVTIDDADAVADDVVTADATVTHPAPTATTDTPVDPRPQTWTARFPMADLTGGGLDDGRLTIAGTYDRVTEERVETTPEGATEPVVTYTHTAAPIGGRTRTLLKDLVAPMAPAVFPPGGVHYGPQSVTVTADDEAQETVRYTAAATAAKEPAEASARVPVPLPVNTSQELRFAAYDRAGNRSATVVETYDIRTLSAPGAPTGVTGEPGDGSVALSWTPPGEDGGRPVTEYAVRAYDPAGAVARTYTATGTTLVAGGLTNGTAYTFDVRAVNAAGTGAASPRSAAVTPRTLPGAPTIGAPTAGTGSATVRWTPPASDGGAPVTGYGIRVYAGGIVVHAVDAPVGTSFEVTGLTDGTAHEFDVHAVTAAGPGPVSARSAAVTPRSEFVAPAVTARSPAANATAVAQGTNVTATFGEPVAGVDGTTVRLVKAGTTTPVAAAVTYDPATRVVTLNPTATALAADTRYTVTLTGGIRDAAGNALAVTSWTFTTGPRPALTKKTPGTGATGVKRNAGITATFGEPVTGVSTATVKLTRVSGGAAVTGTVSYHAGTRTLTFDPYGTTRSVLLARTRYRVSLTAGIRDAAGNPLTPVTWTFTTGAA